MIKSCNAMCRCKKKHAARIGVIAKRCFNTASKMQNVRYFAYVLQSAAKAGVTQSLFLRNAIEQKQPKKKIIFTRDKMILLTQLNFIL